MKRSARIETRAFALAAGSAIALASCGGGSGSGSTSTAPVATRPATSAPTTAPSSTTPSARKPERPHRKPSSPSHPGSKPHRPPPPVVPPGAAQALHGYVDALDTQDGRALCRLFRPGALDVLRLPKGSGCDGLSASIGYRPPHGLPQWQSAKISGVKGVVTESDGVRVTVTIVDRYRRNPQPSIEDDVIFLARSGGRWLIQQPSVTIYRAIGVANPPPSVLAAP